jgi:hypothetical protein
MALLKFLLSLERTLNHPIILDPEGDPMIRVLLADRRPLVRAGLCAVLNAAPEMTFLAEECVPMTTAIAQEGTPPVREVSNCHPCPKAISSYSPGWTPQHC